MSARACILGCAGPALTAAEAAFFREARPLGFILFRRNIESPDQVRALCASMREAVGREDAVILVDQEGGRVQRLGPPHWPKYPPGRAYRSAGMAWLGARLIAHDLAEVGISANAMPVLDMPTPGAHDVIGDRAYGEEPEVVAELGRAAAEGLLAGRVLPVIKHIPGHGRAMADSHEGLPVVKASREDLEGRDFRPFRALADMPMAMSAHLVFAAIDPDAPATLSRTVVRQVIRGWIGFDGLLMTDDLSMRALSGGFRARAERAIAAGCDVVLHCNGGMDEMAGVVEGAPMLSGEALRRADAALGRLAQRREPVDIAALRARFEAGMR